MPTKTIDRHYDHFSPTERLTLFIEAMARNDNAEVDRLRTSCPRKTYLMTDTAFADRMEFIYDVTLVVAGDLRWHLGKLWIAEVAKDLGPQLTERHAFGTRVSFYEGYLLGRGEPAMNLLGRDGDVDHHKVATVRAEDEASAAEPQEASDPEPLNAEDAARFEIPEGYVAHADAFYKRLWTPTIEKMAEDMLSIWAAFEAFTTQRLDLEPIVVMNAFCPPAAQQINAALLRYKKVMPNAEAVAEYSVGIEEAWVRCGQRSL